MIGVVSSFYRKYNRGGISKHKRDRHFGSFFEEATGRLVIITVDKDCFGSAFDLVLEDDFRRLDSLQRATTLGLSTANTGTTFVCVGG